MRRKYLQPGFLALAPQAHGQEFDVKAAEPKLFEEYGALAVIRISGPLEQHPNWQWLDYETILCQAEAAFASTARAVALCVNSPGGSAAGCFELSRALRELSEKSRKPLGVFVDGMAASAAYAIACAATPGLLMAPMTSTVASLAVYEALIDQTAADTAAGLRFLFIPSTGADLKLTGNAHVSPSAEMVEHTQAQVDLLTEYFYSLVEEMRADAGVMPGDVQALRGATLLASQGVDRGLVDEINDWKGFLARLENFEGIAMPQAKAKSPFSDALAALAAAAAEGDDEEKTAAKKMLAAHYGASGEEPNGEPKPEPAGKAEGEPEPEPEKDEEKAKAEADEKARAEADEKAKAASAEDEKMKAQAAKAGQGALAVSNEIALANQVQALANTVSALTSKLNASAEADERAKLFATRPDFSAEVKKAYAGLSIDALRVVVKTAPRVNVTPAAAASAAVPDVTPGRADNARVATSVEQSLLDRLDKGTGPQAAHARLEGANLVLDVMTPEAAAKRVKEMTEQGLVPKGIPHDMARTDPSTFKASQVRK